MPEPLHYLASWAAELTPEDVPHDVLVRAQVQHLSAAGNLRAVHRWVLDPDQVTEAGRSAAKCALIDYSDHLFWGKTTLGAVFASLENPKGRSALDTLTATVVANEVAARYGAATSLSSDTGQQAAQVHSLAAAAAWAKIHRLTAEQTQASYARALSQTPVDVDSDEPSLRRGARTVGWTLHRRRHPGRPVGLRERDLRCERNTAFQAP